MHDLPISLNYGVISPFRDGLKFREYKNLTKNSEFAVCGQM